MHPVALPAHHIAGDIVGDDPVAILARELGLRMFENLIGFSCEPDQQLWPLKSCAAQVVD